MSEPPLVLVTGAAGAIGPTLVRALLKAGYRVKAMVRSQPPSRLWPEAVETVVGDVRDRDFCLRAAAGVTAIFHLAAKLHLQNPGPELKAEYERVNILGTRAVVEAAGEAGARRLIFFSTISVYGPTGPEPVDERTSPRPDTVYAETKLRAEETALASGLGVVLRMSAVYGPRMKGNYMALAHALERGRFVPIGAGTNLRTLVYSADAVRAAILAAEHPSAVGHVYNVSDGSLHSVTQIVAAICEALGREYPRVAVPAGLARLAASVADGAMAAAGRPRRFEAAVEKYMETIAVRSEQIQRDLGFRPEYDLRRGWAEAIRAR